MRLSATIAKQKAAAAIVANDMVQRVNERNMLLQSETAAEAEIEATFILAGQRHRVMEKDKEREQADIVAQTAARGHLEDIAEDGGAGPSAPLKKNTTTVIRTSERTKKTKK